MVGETTEWLAITRVRISSSGLHLLVTHSFLEIIFVFQFLSSRAYMDEVLPEL